jgi:Polyketide cyclase / dehydrase and lipid transport
MTDPVFRFREECLADAPIEVVFETVTDHESYADWSSCDEAYLEVEGSPERNGFGSVRVFRDTTSIKDGVLAVKEITNHYWPPYLHGYRVLDPSVVRHHQGFVLLEPVGDNQTKITWHMTSSPVDANAAEVLRPQLGAGVRTLVADLAAEAARRHKAQQAR